jgi:hypothetical protein
MVMDQHKAQWASREPVVAAVRNFQPDAPPENILTTVKATHKFGRYSFVS